MIAESIESGWNIGAQLFVKVNGRTEMDYAVGLSRLGGSPMTRNTMLPWYSSTKPLTSVCVAQCMERGLIGLDDPVARYFPDFEKHGKGAITVAHLLTHTSPISRIDLSFRMKGDFDFVTQQISDAYPEKDWVPGEKARYHPTSGMHMLAAIVEKVDGRRFAEYIRQELFAPLQMPNCWVGMPPGRFDKYGDVIGTMLDVRPEGFGEPPLPCKESTWKQFFARTMPGGNGIGPMHELARFYEAMRRGGELDGERVLRTETVTQFTSVQRRGVPSYPDGDVSSTWGYGFRVGTALGRPFASPQLFGHAGSASSVGYCDPVRDLVVAAIFNGRYFENGQRFQALNKAIYRDLGFV